MTPQMLYPRGRTSEQFPTLDVYVDPAYVSQVGSSAYVSRIAASLAVANTIYQQSGLKQVRLLAILLADQNIGRSNSQGNVVHPLEKIRRYTIAPDSADGSIVFTDDDFTLPNLWGWAELGFGCELQKELARSKPIKTHKVGKASAAVIDLPTLIQRGWILGHEFIHIIGGVHV